MVRLRGETMSILATSTNHPTNMKASHPPTAAESSPTRNVRKGRFLADRTGRRRTAAGLAAVVALVVATCAHAAPITMVTSNAASGSSWLNGNSWSDGLAPAAGNSYFVTGTTFTVRTPQTGAAFYSFGGDSLTINNARFLFATLGGSNIFVNNLTVTNGGMFSNGTNALQILQGTLAISGSAFVRLHTVGAEAGRNITIASQISGSGSVGLIQKGTLSLTGVGNTFSGIWTVGGTGVTVPDGTYSNSSSLISSLIGSSAGSLGVNSSVTLNIWSRFDVDYDWTTSGALTLADNGGAGTAIIMTLDQNITVGALSVAGFSFAEGVYSYADLSTAGFGDYFTNSGGSITVVPEPSAVALLALGSMSIVFWSRRLRNKVS
jgi:hypothetical protein